MASSLERRAVADLIKRADELGVPVPAAIHGILGCGTGSYASTRYADEHPEDEHGRPTGDVPEAMLYCCAGSATRGLHACTCWEPEWNGVQADPRPLTGPEDLTAMPAQCGDCAFRRDSPERQEAWLEESLLNLPKTGEPFWCHDGLRRPARWRHPAGPTVEGSPDDWQPPMVGAVPYRLDGSPASLCHGWAVRAAKALAEEDVRG